MALRDRTKMLRTYKGSSSSKGLVSKEALLNILDTVSTILKPDTIRIVQDYAKVISKYNGPKDKIIKTLMLGKNGYKNDVEFLEDIANIMDRYTMVIPELKSKIDKELPEQIPLRTSNPNIRIAIAMVSTGVFLAKDLPVFIIFLLNKFYLGDNEEKPDLYGTVDERIKIINTLKKLKYASFGKIVAVIGSIPEFDQDPTKIPTTFLTGLFKRNFNITNNNLLNMLVNFITGKKQDVKTDFIGNPIYHIRIILADLELNRLERYKESKRLAELKLLELKAKLNNASPEELEKIRKQINYYEEKIERLNLKIKAIEDDIKG